MGQPQPLEGRAEIQQGSPMGNAGIAGAAAEAYRPGTRVLGRGAGDQFPGGLPNLQGAEGAAMSPGLAGLNAQFSETAKEAEESRLLKRGQTATANFDASRDEADAVLGKDGSITLNTALNKPLSELKINAEEGVTDQQKAAFVAAVEKDWGTKITVDKGLDPNGGGNDGNCDGGDCNGGGGGGGGGGGDNSDSNNLDGGNEPAPTPVDNTHRIFSKDALDLSKAAAETHWKGDKGVVNNWMSHMSPALLAAMANMTPEELAEFLKNHPDLAKEKSDMESEMAEESKARSDKGDTEGAEAINKFAKDFKAPSGEFQQSLKAYADASQDGGQPSAEIVDKLMPEGVQRAVLSNATDKAAQQLINEPNSQFKGMDLSKAPANVDEAKKLGDLFKAASEKLNDGEFVKSLFKGKAAKRETLEL
jgi:hypothetical protein